MAVTTKRRPLEMEPGEGKAHEKAESSSEELREGAEPDDMPHRGRRSNRKRSTKGADHTKAPMDGEGCSCGGGKKGRKASCDGGCGSYGKKMDRNDALTPQEYLAACDLGVQGQSRAYIRARLDMAERLDLKCGNGSISPGEKCRVGTAQQVQSADKAKPSRRQQAENTLIKRGGQISGAATALGLAATFAGKPGLARQLNNLASIGGVAEGAGRISRGQRTGNKGEVLAGSFGLANNVGLTGYVAGKATQAAFKGVRSLRNNPPDMSMIGKKVRYAPSNAVGRARMAIKNRRPMPKPKMKGGQIQNPWDSMYADGFAVDYTQLAV